MNGGPDDPPQIFRTRMPARYSIGLLLLGAVVTVMVPLALVSEGSTGAAAVAVLLAVLFLGIALMRVTVRVGAGEVSIILAGIIRTAIPYHRIDAVSVAVPTGIAAGMGLRILPNSTTGYLVGGPAVRVTTGSTAVVVSAGRPEELVAAIGRRRGPAA